MLAADVLWPCAFGLGSALELNFDSVCREIEAQTACRAQELDHDTMLVLEVGRRSTASDRQPGSYGHVISIQIFQILQVVYASADRAIRDPDVDHRQPNQP